MIAGRATKLTWSLLLGLAASPIVAQAGSVTVSHPSPTLVPGAESPLIQLRNATVTNTGADFEFTIQLFNPTSSGPSMGTADAVFGFWNLDTDLSAASGLSAEALDMGLQGGFGRYSAPTMGVDAFISLTSEGDPFAHPTEGLVDLIRASDGVVLETVAIVYRSQPGGLSFALPVSVFSGLPGFTGVEAGVVPYFSVVVGNVDGATDVVSYVTTAVPVPEPSTLWISLVGLVGVVLSSVLSRKSAHKPS